MSKKIIIFVLIAGALATTAIDYYLGITEALKEIGILAQASHKVLYALWGYAIIKSLE